jgi:hypothetical protein
VRRSEVSVTFLSAAMRVESDVSIAIKSSVASKSSRISASGTQTNEP